MICYNLNLKAFCHFTLLSSSLSILDKKNRPCPRSRSAMKVWWLGLQTAKKWRSLSSRMSSRLHPADPEPEPRSITRAVWV